MERSRITYLITVIVVVILGLFSRQYSQLLPEFVATYAGDTLWALAAFLGIGMLFPRWSTARVVVTTLLFAFSIELSQLYHAQWIDQIRHTRLGGLILGYGFLWSDLPCYGVGVAVGCSLEVVFGGLIAKRYYAGSTGSGVSGSEQLIQPERK